MKLLLLALIGIAIASTSGAQNAPAASKPATQIIKVKTDNPERTPVTGGALTERTYTQLTKIYEQIGANQNQAAVQALQALLPKVEGELGDKAEVLRALGHTSLALERYTDAARYLEEVVKLDVLPNQQHFDVMFQIAQAYIVQDKYNEGLAALDRWFKVTNEVSNTAYELQASALAQLKRYREALAAIDRAIAMTPRPKESWWQMKLAMHFELKEYPKAAEVLERLIEASPDNKSYWEQLSAMYINMEADSKALAVMALAHRRGLLTTAQQYRQLSQLYAYLRIPYKAAVIMQEGLSKGIIENSGKSLEELANHWYAAADYPKALAAYEQAGKLSASGKIDFQRGSILADQEDWAGARDALKSAITKGDLGTNACQAQLILGNAEYALNNAGAALGAFQEARQGDRCRQTATSWIEHINEERRAAEAKRQQAVAAEDDAATSP